MKTLLITSIVAIGFGSLSCGTKEERQKKSDPVIAEVITSEATSSADLATASEEGISDAMDALNDVYFEDTTSLALGTEITLSRNCEKKSDYALISINNTLAIDTTREGPFATWETKFDGSDNTTRKWSQNGSPLECGVNKLFPVVPFDTTALKIEVDFNRSLKGSIKRTGKIAGLVTSKNVDYTAIGHRVFTGLSHELSESGDIMRSWQVESDVLRCNAHKGFSYSVSTDASSPLIVDSERGYPSFSYTTKTYKSGKVIIQRSSDLTLCDQASPSLVGSDKLELTFTNFSTKIDASFSCDVLSGTVLAEYFKSGETVASKSIEIIVENGEATATDKSTGDEIVGFELPVCSNYSNSEATE